MKQTILQHRRLAIILYHLFLFAAAYWLSFALRFDLQIPEHFLALFTLTLPLTLLIKYIIFDRFGLFQGWLRYVGMKDLSSIIQAALVSALVLMTIGYIFFKDHPFPRSIPILDFVMVVALVGGSRFAIRAYREGALENLIKWGDSEQTRILVIGAGDAGESLVREIQKRPELNYHIVGYLDDSLYKQGARIHGVRVLGGIEEIKAISEKYEVDELFLAVPSASRSQMKRIVDLCEQVALPMRTIPGMDQLIDGKVTVSQLREVQLEDLLGRDPVELDRMAIGDYLHDKKVLVTGAAGSIGSEICRQVLAFEPSQLILVDHHENGIFEMSQELKGSTSRAGIRMFVADVTDKNRMAAIFRETTPEVVFHAAAYKHVPVMEENPAEAVKNNIGGSRLVADLCDLTGVRRAVMISTDKAINPTSVMGATKRIAERYVQFLSKKSETKYITVRFGNVLGSAGSVIPIFKKQIQNGGPVTVTHREMTRFFMTISEASQLVLQAGSMGRGGEIYVLDMGDPVRIYDLAESMIKLSGYKPEEDIKIECIGARPGEKLYEELYLDNELHSKTSHPKVFTRNCVDEFPHDFIEKIEELLDLADTSMDGNLKITMAELVPEYQGVDMPAAVPASSVKEFISGQEKDQDKPRTSQNESASVSAQNDSQPSPPKFEEPSS
ncbi:MAG: nucleoside-diphosphate sugar epimerase/dehydratase [bacterium]